MNIESQKVQFRMSINKESNKILLLEEQVKRLKIKKEKYPNIKNYITLGIISEYIKIIEVILIINKKHLKLYEKSYVQNIEQGRKILGYIFIEINHIMPLNLNLDFKEITNTLDKMSLFTAKKRLHLVQKLQNINKQLEENIPSNSKWMWYFVDAGYNIATVVRNCIHFQDLDKIQDTTHPDYHNLQTLFELYKSISLQNALRLRTKYELSSRSKNDIIKAKNLLIILKKSMNVIEKSSKKEIYEIQHKIDVFETLLSNIKHNN